MNINKDKCVCIICIQHIWVCEYAHSHTRSFAHWILPVACIRGVLRHFVKPWLNGLVWGSPTACYSFTHVASALNLHSPPYSVSQLPCVVGISNLAGPKQSSLHFPHTLSHACSSHSLPCFGKWQLHSSNTHVGVILASSSLTLASSVCSACLQMSPVPGHVPPPSQPLSGSQCPSTFAWVIIWTFKVGAWHHLVPVEFILHKAGRIIFLKIVLLRYNSYTIKLTCFKYIIQCF